MENSPLNKAHQEHRRADALLKQKKFDECIDCHKNAIDLLSQSMKLTNHPQALESFRLQMESHERQIRLISLRKIQYENYRNTEGHKASVPICHSEPQLVDYNLQSVYDTMNQHDSFISYLIRRDASSDNESYSMSDTEEKIEKIVNVNGFKHPKDDTTIIEEFKELCNSYRDSIKKLLVQLEERNKEVKDLKNRIKQLEHEQDQFKAQSKINSSLKVITDSSGGTSPYVYSPSSERSELSPEVREISELPQLAPLESPPFDFTNLAKSLSSNSQNN